MTGGPVSPPSLRRELVRTLTLVSGTWLLAVFLAMAFGVRHEVDDMMDDALQEASEVLYGMLVVHGPHLPMEGGMSLPAQPHDERLVWQIVGQDQKVLLRSHKAPDSPLLPAFKPGISDGPGHWRVYAARLPAEALLLYVGQPAWERIESRYEVIAVVGASGLGVGLLCALWVRHRVRTAWRSLEDLSEQVKAYDPMHLQTGLPAPSRSEFIDMHQAIMELGRRLARRVENEQAFAAHAAHALRTPLAGMDAQLAIAMKDVDPGVRPRIERVREAVGRLKLVITSLLALFRSHAALDLQDLDLSQLVARLPIESLDVQVDQGGPLLADPNLMAAALANILDNAARYGARRCWITCTAESTRQFVTVRDDGPGLPPQRCVELQRHVDQVSSEGVAGLGLKLAALVARAHHGKVRIDGTTPGATGLAVTLALWSEAPPPANSRPRPAP